MSHELRQQSCPTARRNFIGGKVSVPYAWRSKHFTTFPKAPEPSVDTIMSAKVRLRNQNGSDITPASSPMPSQTNYFYIDRCKNSPHTCNSVWLVCHSDYFSLFSLSLSSFLYLLFKPTGKSPLESGCALDFFLLGSFSWPL